MDYATEYKPDLEAEAAQLGAGGDEQQAAGYVDQTQPTEEFVSQSTAQATEQAKPQTADVLEMVKDDKASVEENVNEP